MTPAATLARPRVRLRIAVAALAVVVAGLAVTRVSGPVADAAGDALYTVLLCCVVAFLAPAARPVVVGVAAWGVCALIEISQLTGAPAWLVERWDPVRYLLGTTFTPVDLVAYAAGAGAGALLCARLTRSRP